jgi:hypothetical protein
LGRWIQKRIQNRTSGSTAARSSYECSRAVFSIIEISGLRTACGPCTNINKLAAGVSYLPLVLTVNVGAGAVSPVTNSATVSRRRRHERRQQHSERRHDHQPVNGTFN